jgi:membrane protein implicated in regulation of membrane protease activity
MTGDLEETVKNTVKGFMLLVFAMMSLVLAKEYFPRNKRGSTRSGTRYPKKLKDKKGKLSDPEPGPPFPFLSLFFSL